MRSYACLVLLGLLVLTGCGSSVEVVLNGQSNMNSGGNPAVVRIYELNGESNFMRTPVSSFWKDDVAALGSELVSPAPRDVTVYPSKSETLEFEIAEGTQFIGVAANLRNPTQEQWRAVFPVEEANDRIRVTVHEGRITVEAEGQFTLPI